jgi:hypothetical protein
MKIGAIHGSGITASSENPRIIARQNSAQTPTSSDNGPIGAPDPAAAPGATDGTCRAGISPGTSEALAQLVMPADQTSVSPRTMPLAINSRSRSSENGPSCLPSRPVYHCRSAMYSPLELPVTPAWRTPWPAKPPLRHGAMLSSPADQYGGDTHDRGGWFKNADL